MTGLSKLGLLPLLLTGSAVAFSGSGSPLRVHVRRINVNVNVNASPRLARGYEYAYIRSTSTLFQSIKGNEETDEYLIISGTSVPPQSVSAPPKVQKATASKREMMGFAIPALGIFLTNPLLSNIDNAFVGQTIGATGLAALSPATLCTDQVLYLFSFLSRATTGLVSRAYAGGDTQKAKEAASAPLMVSLLCGLVLAVLYAVLTPTMLSAMNVNPSLIPSAASYIYWRGAIAWAALAQACALQIMLATRDAVTPLVIVATAALLNIAGDYLLCMWPFRWGCAGAAAATSIATLLSSGLMLVALKRKDLLPKVRLPSKKEMISLSEFTGPLLAITITRLVGFVAMQRRAMTLGLQPLAAFQLCINVVTFFLLFAEPLSQLSQTNLPPLMDADDGDAILANLKSVLTLGLGASVSVGALAFFVTRFMTGIFTSDSGVQLMAHAAAPAVFLAVSQAIMAVTVDGAMLASRDFKFMLLVGISTCLLQLGTLKWCTSLWAIFGTFSFRLGCYTVAVVTRVATGNGALGRAIKKSWVRKKAAP
jgi:putative MATE family efflux protein